MNPITKDCKDVLSLPVLTLTHPFLSNLKKETEKIISCFYSCFKNKFKKWALITYNSYPKDSIEFIADTSFTDAVLLFSEKASAGEIYDGKASTETILKKFYWYKLRGQLQKEKRLSVKKERFALDNKANLSWMDDTSLSAEEKFLLLEKALAELEPMDKQIILWRQIELKSPDEIASLLAISKDAASNRIYRCMERLRSLISNNRETNEYQR
jgi:RNA polymerase sigma factor (sigma-70 family)